MARSEDAASTLSCIAWRRHLPAFAWVLGVVSATIAIYVREPKVRLLAAKDLSPGHQIESGDVHSEATDALVGHFLLKAVKGGDSIDETMVTGAAAPSPAENNLAVRVEVAASSMERQKLATGSAAVLTRGGRQLGPVGTIAAVDCNQRFCKVVLTFANLTTLSVDPADLAGAELSAARQPAKKP